MNLETKNKLKVSIREITRAELPDIVKLETRIFPDPWSLYAFEEQLAVDNAGGIVAESNNEIIGYACYYIAKNESHLTNIAVAPEYRRKSVAKQLLEDILKAVAGKKCQSIFLEVRHSNNDAVAFYEKHNFKVLYRLPDYYRRPVEDALVMVLYLDADKKY